MRIDGAANARGAIRVHSRLVIGVIRAPAFGCLVAISVWRAMKPVVRASIAGKAQQEPELLPKRSEKSGSADHTDRWSRECTRSDPCTSAAGHSRHPRSRFWLPGRHLRMACDETSRASLDRRQGSTEAQATSPKIREKLPLSVAWSRWPRGVFGLDPLIDPQPHTDGGQPKILAIEIPHHPAPRRSHDGDPVDRRTRQLQPQLAA